MQTLYVEKNIPRIALTKALSPVRKDIYFSRLSHMRIGQIDSRLPGPQWVRVENQLAGICGTDLQYVYADADLRVAPATLVPGNHRINLGHEILGHVADTGSDVTLLTVGDRVVLQFMFGSCLSEGIDPACRYCAVGNANLCENAAECRSDPVGGGWGEGFLAHEVHLFRVPAGLSDEEAVLLEPAAVGVHAVLRRPPERGQHALVLGCGIIGLLTLQAARAVAPEAKITAIARYPHQAVAARRLGADHVLTGKRDTYRMIAQLTGARHYEGSFGSQVLVGGFDVIYDCVGKAGTVEDALRWTRAGGAVVIVGIDLNRLKLDLTPVWYYEVDLLGSMASGAETWNGERLSTFELTARWFAEGKLTADGLITHRFPLADYRKAIETATDKSNRSIKVVFDLRTA
ncbi:MAG: zinc-binding dehydrogenase [Anaerolineae bacterium]